MEKPIILRRNLLPILNITVRSAHRILLQWMDAELIDIVGEEKLTSKGRPRRIYRLTFVTKRFESHGMIFQLDRYNENNNPYSVFNSNTSKDDVFCVH